MKNTLAFLLMLSTSTVLAQNKNTVFYDSLGQLTTYENHGSQVFTGRYTSVYNKKENTKTLVKSTDEQFHMELKKTEKRIVTTKKLGTDFPDFEMTDINGISLSKSDLNGKVIVIDFWFVGCVPCEAERPLLNELVKYYAENEDVVFIAFAKNNKEQLDVFLKEHPFYYRILPTDKDYIKIKFDVDNYPVNLVIDRSGKYFFNSLGSGVGIMTILQRQIEKALEVN